eukprot:6177636-Pleurochrysis_carterae.AAC.3
MRRRGLAAATRRSTIAKISSNMACCVDGAGRSDGCVALCTMPLKSRYRQSNSIPFGFGAFGSPAGSST